MIRHQFGQVEFASEHWFRLAATTLASVTRAAGLATPAKPRDAHIRRIDLVAINDGMASLILVLREGTIKQALVTIDGDDASTSRPSTRSPALLNERLVDMTATRAPRPARRAVATDDRVAGHSPGASASGSSRSCASTTPPPSRRSSATACSTSWTPPSSPRATSSGASSAPSRTGSTSAELVGSVAARGRVQVFIGHENQPSRCATSRSSSRRTAGPAGRSASSASSGRRGCRYSQAIGTVRFVSGLMNELVDHLYA